MKRYIIIFLSAIALTSCSFLDVSTRDYHNTAYQFKDFASVKSMLTNIYGYFPDQFTSESYEVATDNGQNAYETAGIKKFYDGTWEITNQIDDVWGSKYSAIRSCNYFLENAPEDFPAAKYLEDYAAKQQQMQYYRWEARAIRAFLHYELMIRYRDIIISDKCYSMEEVNDLPVSSYLDVAEWIANECDIVAEHLPKTYKGVGGADETWRVTRGFALSLKARVLLYASSPLTAEKNLSSSGYDKKLASRAAEAAKSVMELNQYFLGTNIVFNSIDEKQIPYLIFGIVRGGSTSFESSNFPMGYEGGYGGACPSDNLAAAFEFSNGTSFDWDNPSHAANPYANRDPRFYRTIYYNDCAFKDVKLENYTGGQNGLPKKGATPTTYYLAKLIVEATDLTQGATVAYKHVWPVFRFHETYLNYAEALFEATGDPSFTGELDGVDYTISPTAAVNEVRKSSNMPAIGALDSEKFRAKLRNERRVELAFEDHRFWDIRRWKIAPDVKDVYGVTITKTDDGFKYQRNPNPITTGLTDSERSWDDKYYWHPYPRSETKKNKNLVQHSGW